MGGEKGVGATGEGGVGNWGGGSRGGADGETTPSSSTDDFYETKITEI